MLRSYLRPYQIQGINETYEKLKRVYRLIFKMPTGTGKTFTFCAITEDAVRWGLPVVIVVRRRDLIDQGSKNLSKWKIPHGVYMSGHKKFRPKRDVQICSIDTLDARSSYPHVGRKPLIIIDESQDCTPKAKKYAKFLEQYPNSKVVGFTATPYSDNSLFDDIVAPIDAVEAMEKGFLVPVKIFTPKNQIDTSNIKKKQGDFDKKKLFEASSGSKIVGDFVRDWQLYSQGRPTVLFAVNVEHSKMIAEAFNKAGIKAVHADANTKGDKRELMLKKLARGDIKVMCNVNIFSTGVDVPEVACIQVCRPTSSLIWYLQAIGRGLRPSPQTGKTNCIIIDNAGNTFRFGSPYTQHKVVMNKGKKDQFEMDEDDVNIRTCKKCQFVFEANIRQCPECNHVNPPVERNIKQEEGDLVEYNLSPEEKEQMEKGLIVADCLKLSYVAKRNIKITTKGNWVRSQIKKKYGIDKFIKYRETIDNTITVE